MLCALLALVPTADAQITIRITRSSESAQPVAVVPFAGSADLPVDLADIVAADLERSGVFKPMPVTEMPDRPSEFSAIKFEDWRRLNMDSLVIGSIATTAPDRYEISFRVVNVIQGNQIAGYRMPATAANLRHTAHRIADVVFEQLTGKKGAFATRIAYVTVDRDNGVKRYRLLVADIDGANARTLLESPQPIMSPDWAPDGERIAYVSFENRNSAIYVQDVPTGNRQVVASGEGINSSPAFSPDGRRLAMTLSRDGNPEIYVRDLDSGQLQRLTADPAIDTEASWSPDGRRLAFTSDRGGGPQIYLMDYPSGQVRRVTFDKGSYNARPRFAPDGDMLALVHQNDGGYRIAVLGLKDDSFRILSNSKLDESPSFAPNGQMILYATDGVLGTELAAVSVNGRVRQRLAVPYGEVREPAWGPFRE
ncbi:MAG: Tol-Pal system beta propeller repeat protein TolB [Gammaproteobacteria bacterium]|nr:Tol-Pal system beta propeller repeat protein TolB [Gammaproteobacteria bacterium]